MTYIIFSTTTKKITPQVSLKKLAEKCKYHIIQYLTQKATKEEHINKKYTKHLEGKLQNEDIFPAKAIITLL